MAPVKKRFTDSVPTLAVTSQPSDAVWNVYGGVRGVHVLPLELAHPVDVLNSLCYIRKMRYQTMLNTIVQNIKFVRIQQEAVPDIANSLRLKSMARFREAILALNEIPILAPMAKSIIDHPLFQLPDEIIVDKSKYAEISNMAGQLFNDANTLKHVPSQTTKVSQNEIIAIKLPELKKLEDIKAFIHAINNIFDVPVRRIYGDGVAFGGFDTGSDWIIINPETVETAKQAATVVCSFSRNWTFEAR